jgi:hypothetical protein
MCHGKKKEYIRMECHCYKYRWNSCDDIRRQVKQLNKSRRLYSVQILKGEQIFLCVNQDIDGTLDLHKGISVLLSESVRSKAAVTYLAVSPGGGEWRED